jgi:hypothetical protein
MSPLRTVVACFVLLAAAHAWAQTLKSVKVEPAQIEPGGKAKVIAEFDISGGVNCNVRVHFGDGQSKDFHVNQDKDAVATLEHTWAKAGTYKVKVEPKTALPKLKCLGDNQVATLAVVAPPPPPPPKAAGPQCPDGWKLAARSVNRKTGAYTCTAKAGTAAPAGKLECPGKLAYFENVKTGQLGCRP